MNETTLNNPVGVFDAGVGSFGIVETVKKHYPKQDVIWLADRASFPLGKKTPDELFEIGKANIEVLCSRGVEIVIVAANVLTMVVMARLRSTFPELKLFGMMPPVQKASEFGDFCILGVKAMVEDPKLYDYVEEIKPHTVRAFFANASPLIDELVETGAFITQRDATLLRVKEYMESLPIEQRDVAAYTLSSTHLPWLKFAFEKACPDKVFLDPADDLVAGMNLPNDGNGTIHALATENIKLSMTNVELQKMLILLGYKDIIPSLLAD